MSSVYSTQFEAWTCTFSLEIIEPKCDPEPIVSEIKGILQAYEGLFSRFQKESVISKLNRGESVQMSEHFKEVLQIAEELSHSISCKFFNPHVNVAAHGYANSFDTDDFQDTDKCLEDICPFPSGIDKRGNTIKLKKGCNVDFGAFLKGYLAQLFADTYQACGRGLIVNFGGDLCVRGSDVHSDVFRIGIFNPITHQDETISLKAQSLSTSGVYKRHWDVGGGRKHHLLDPTTNENPDTEFVSISFFGSNGALCDALSTAAFSAPVSQWDTWKKTFKDVEYFAITKSGSVRASFSLTT